MKVQRQEKQAKGDCSSEKIPQLNLKIEEQVRGGRRRTNRRHPNGEVKVRKHDQEGRKLLK